MYEFLPKAPKNKEKLILFCLLGLAVLLFGVSRVPNLPFPAGWQLISVILLVGVVLIATRYLLREYTYCIAPREEGYHFTSLDFTIVEHYSRRSVVVCRISVTDILEVTRVTRENRKQLFASLKGKRVYDYTARILPDDLYLLTVKDGEDSFFVRVEADERLVSFIIG